MTVCVTGIRSVAIESARSRGGGVLRRCVAARSVGETGDGARYFRGTAPIIIS